MPSILFPPPGGIRGGGRNSDVLLLQKTPFTGARNFGHPNRILTQINAIPKDGLVFCPHCGQSNVVKYGFYHREPIRHPDCLCKPLKIQRYKCKNKRRDNHPTTFSFPPFPLLPRVGIPVTELVDLATILALATWSVLLGLFPDHSLLTVNRWRKRGTDFLAWLKTSSILEEPHLTWARFQFAFSRHPYPQGQPP